MGIEQSGGTDTRVEGADEPPGRDRPPAPPPDRPGQPGTPSRLESLRAAREAQLASAAEQESRQTAPPKASTDQRDEIGGKETEPSREQQASEEAKTANDSNEPKAEIGEPTEEPNAEQRVGGEDKEAKSTPVQQQYADKANGPEATDEVGGTSTDAEEGDASLLEPEIAEMSRPVDSEVRPGPADTSEATGQSGGEHLDIRIEESEGLPGETTAQSLDPPAGTEAAEGQPAARDAETGTTEQAERPNEPGEDRRLPDAGEAAPQASEEPDRADSLDTIDGRPTMGSQAAPHEAPMHLNSQETGPVSLPETEEEGRGSPTQVDESDFGSQTENQDSDSRERPEPQTIAKGSKSKIDQQLDLGDKMARLADQKVDSEIDLTLTKVNPKFDWTRSDYSENCTGVVQANELRRRGHDVEAGPLEKHLRSDQNGPGGRNISVIEQAWGGKFTPGTKAEIEEAFKQPGSRGIVYIAWNGVNSGAHVFSVENVGGRVRFVDGQPKPPLRDVAHYFTAGHSTKYLRVDDLPTPSNHQIDPFLEP
ncbi:toxin glutamine deamidase domain-containing protein [Actinomadura mexicana]|uniref:Papain fold toxin 1, glutamine deamidase n=1 Tax=Actinomadura mexicana TaxID=134959 RepID=A0A239FEX2_9ACTN|nr:toxin glutamine deamidase domain-containing protein [Actinomadura mexicana]SNS55311.1 Papain fold toxin 1, glutamine deamidase [Actinomadura mexicana]